MKKIFLLVAFFLQAIQGQSVSFEKTNPMHILKEEVLVLEYEYTSEVEGFVESALNLYNEENILKKTIVSAKKTSAIGDNLVDTISLELPDETETTEEITENDRYRVAIQLSDSKGDRLAGVEELVKEVQSTYSIEFSDATAFTATTGSSVALDFTYTSDVAATVSVALNLYYSNGNWKETVNYNSVDVIAGTAVSTSIALDIPSNAQTSSALTDGDYYKFVIELKNGATWLAGDYPSTVVTLEQGNSISFDSSLTSSASIGETIDINYIYNSDVAASVSVALNLYASDGSYKKTVSFNTADVSSGTAISTSIALDIPSDVDASSVLTDGDYYKFVIELKNGATWLAGDYPSTVVTLWLEDSISFTEFPTEVTAGSSFDIGYSYFTSQTQATVTCALNLYNSDGTVKDYITSFQKEVGQVTNFTNELINLTIPSGTYIAPTADLESGEYYKFVIMLIGEYIGQTYQYAVDEDEFLVTGTSLSGGEAVKKYNTISVYPNPSSESLKIEGFSKGEKLEVQVFDITGMQVLKQQLETPIIDISRLNEGMYILRVANGNQHKTLKFSKKN